MSVAASQYRLDGIYRQRQDGFFMQRVKLPAGVISACQARMVASISSCFGQGMVHLTTRGSMEIQWLNEGSLQAVKRELAKAGITSRGTCGGAVRGITCSSQGAVGFPAVEPLARRLHRHFTGNPRFERFPKKFKIGVEADTVGMRHLIQDVGLVLSSVTEGGACFDMYVAGGLGREPHPGFLFESSVNENRVIPLIEAVARVYAAHTPVGKRLKHLIREIGEYEFRRLVALEPTANEELPPVAGLLDNMTGATGSFRLVARIPAGELKSDLLAALSDYADRWSGGFLMVTADQDIAFHLDETADSAKASADLERSGLSTSDVNFRVCPGNSTCLVGLSPTREIAGRLKNTMGEKGKTLTWAISGCPNSCSQPQLADVGIITSSLVKGEDGERTPRFDLCRSGDGAFGTIVERSLMLDQLCCKLQEIG